MVRVNPPSKNESCPRLGVRSGVMQTKASTLGVGTISIWLTDALCGPLSRRAFRR